MFSLSRGPQICPTTAMTCSRKVLAASVLFMALAPTHSVFAQTPTFLDLGLHGNFRIFVPTGTANSRVGNAVLVRPLLIGQGRAISYSPQLLVACNGSWISSAIQTSYKFDGTPTALELFKIAKEKEESLPLEEVSFQPIEETQLFYAKPIARQASALCKTAGKEPRNTLIPIAEASKKNDTGLSTAVVLGTSTKIGQTVDVWSRATTFRLVPVILNDGTTWTIDGEIQKNKEPTGTYSMERTAVHCKERTIGAYDTADYEEKGVTPKTRSVPREKLALSSVIPGSVGEGLLEAVCILYGPK